MIFVVFESEELMTPLLEHRRHADNIHITVLARDFRENYMEIELGQGEVWAIIMNIIQSKLLKERIV